MFSRWIKQLRWFRTTLLGRAPAHVHIHYAVSMLKPGPTLGGTFPKKKGERGLSFCHMRLIGERYESAKEPPDVTTRPNFFRPKCVNRLLGFELAGFGHGVYWVQLHSGGDLEQL